jgi:hypothetical protein
VEKVEEKKHIGKFDLPQSIGFIIARLIQQKFPLEGGSTQRDGILLLVFDDEDEIEQYKTIELEHNSLYFKYQLIDTETISGDKSCPYCDNPHVRPTYHAFYELREIWQDNDNVTERYKIGGDLTESKIGRSSV